MRVDAVVGTVGAPEVLDDAVDDHPGRDLARLVPAHPVGDDAEAEQLVDCETVFVGRSDWTFVGDAGGGEH